DAAEFGPAIPYADEGFVAERLFPGIGRALHRVVPRVDVGAVEVGVAEFGEEQGGIRGGAGVPVENVALNVRPGRGQFVERGLLGFREFVIAGEADPVDGVPEADVGVVVPVGGVDD